MSIQNIIKLIYLFYSQQNITRDQQSSVWPEYGTLGMNEISSLPNV